MSGVVGQAGKTRGTARKGAGAGRTCRASGSMLRNLPQVLWAMWGPGSVFSRGVRRYDCHQAARQKINHRGGSGRSRQALTMAVLAV